MVPFFMPPATIVALFVPVRLRVGLSYSPQVAC
jgi:hypothetical protein